MVIRAAIEYSFYVVPFSVLAIKNLDRKKIALHKTTCNLPKYMLNAVTQLPHDTFGIGAYLLKNTIPHVHGRKIHQCP